MLHLKCTEVDVADVLTKASKIYSDVNIGSYPNWINNYTRVLITMDSTNAENLESCKKYLKTKIGSSNILNEEQNDPWTLKGKDVLDLAKIDSDLGRKVKNSIR